MRPGKAQFLKTDANLNDYFERIKPFLSRVQRSFLESCFFGTVVHIKIGMTH